MKRLIKASERELLKLKQLHQQSSYLPTRYDLSMYINQIRSWIFAAHQMCVNTLNTINDPDIKGKLQPVLNQMNEMKDYFYQKNSNDNSFEDPSIIPDIVNNIRILLGDFIQILENPNVNRRSKIKLINEIETGKKEQRRIQDVPNLLEQILQLLRDGQNLEEIERQLDLPESTIRKLKDTNTIFRQQIEKILEDQRKPIKYTPEILSQILEYLRQGFNYAQIERHLHLPDNTIATLRENYQQFRDQTDQILREQNRRSAVQPTPEIIEQILKLLEQGLIYRRVEKQLNLSVGYISRLKSRSENFERRVKEIEEKIKNKTPNSVTELKTEETQEIKDTEVEKNKTPDNTPKEESQNASSQQKLLERFKVVLQNENQYQSRTSDRTFGNNDKSLLYMLRWVITSGDIRGFVKRHNLQDIIQNNNLLEIGKLIKLMDLK